MSELARVGQDHDGGGAGHHGLVEARLGGVEAVDAAVVPDGARAEEQLVEPEPVQHGFGRRADQGRVLAPQLAPEERHAELGHLHQVLRHEEAVGEDRERHGTDPQATGQLQHRGPGIEEHRGLRSQSAKAAAAMARFCTRL